MSDDVVIRLRGIRNQFGSNVVHEDLDLDIRRGEIVGVVGGSGTGKSVLLRTIVGLQRPSAGTVEVLGTDILGGTEAERMEVQTRWGVLFQDGALFSSLTVRENVEVPLKSASDADRETRVALAELKVDHVGPARDRVREIPVRVVGRHAQTRRACPGAVARPRDRVPR